MNKKNLLENIYKYLTPVLPEHIHLYEVKVKGGQGNTEIEVLIDCAGGLQVDECSSIHKAFRNESEETFDDYNIMFSTPGLTRKCTYPQDFLFYPEKDFELKLSEKGKIEGKVEIIDPASNELTITTQSGKKITVNWDEVIKARFKLDF